MSVLITSDLHFTDVPIDSYRWKLFPWLHEQIEKYGVDELYFLGDLCEKKDKHSSILVNRIVSEMSELLKKVDIYCLAGNHDFIDENTPFFKFLGSGFEGSLRYFEEKGTAQTSLGKVLFLPYRGVEGYSEIEKEVNEGLYDYVFMHECFSGCKVSSGIFLNEGMDASRLKNNKSTNSWKKRKVFSGHIHIPQEVGAVEYIGSPYPVYFGDDYQGRVILIDDKKKQSDLYFPCLERWSLRVRSVKELEKSGLQSGDQAKIKVELYRSEMYQWHEIKKQVKKWGEDKGVMICSVELVPMDKVEKIENRKEDSFLEKIESDQEILKRFSSNEKLGRSFVRVGLELLKGKK